MPERNAPKFVDLEQRQQIWVSSSFSSTNYRLHDGSIPYRHFHFAFYSLFILHRPCFIIRALYCGKPKLCGIPLYM